MPTCCYYSGAGTLAHLLYHAGTAVRDVPYTPLGIAQPSGRVVLSSVGISMTTRNSKDRFWVSAVTADGRLTHTELKALLSCPCRNTLYPKGPIDFSGALPRIAHCHCKCSICPSLSAGPMGLLALLLWVRSPSPDRGSEPGRRSRCHRHTAVHRRSLATSGSTAKHPSTRFQEQGRRLHSLGTAPSKTPTEDFNQQAPCQAQSGQRGESLSFQNSWPPHLPTLHLGRESTELCFPLKFLLCPAMSMLCRKQQERWVMETGSGARPELWGHVFPGISASCTTQGELGVYTSPAVWAPALSHQLHAKCLFYRQTGGRSSPAPPKVCVEKKSLLPTSYCL